MKENWKPIKKFEKLYLISDLGRVKSLSRTVLHNNNKTTTVERILKANDNGNGYKYVDLSYKGVRTRAYVHRLVAEHFIRNPYGKPEVNHLNGDKSDNRLKNLEWVTRAENEAHSSINDLNKGHKSNLTLLKMNMIIDLLKTGNYTLEEIRREFKVSLRLLKEIRKTDKQLVQEMDAARSKRKSTGKEIKVFDKTNKNKHTFNSAKQAAKYFRKYDGYFSEVITKSGGENKYFRANYLKRSE